MTTTPPDRTSQHFVLRSILVNDGDSMSGITGSNLARTILNYTTDNMPYSFVSGQNVSVGGETIATMVSSFASHVTPLYSASVPFVVHLLAGANDIRSGDTATNVIANLKAYVNLVRALGANAKIVLATYPVQTDIQANGTQVGYLQNVNDDLIAKWSTSQASGGYGADGLANYWANPTIGPNTYASSAFSNALYSADGQHGTDLTKSIMGPIQEAAVAPFL